MKITTNDGRLNVFRFVGHTAYWEDNVTRGLLAVITRSPAGGLILREILDRCAIPPADPRCETLQQAASSLQQVEVQGQTFFSVSTTEDDDTDRADFAVLVCLTPAAPEQAPTVASTQSPQRSSETKGRFDAVLRCRADGCSFDVVIEAKLYTSVGEEQLGRYHEALGGPDRCSVVQLPWSDIVDLLDALPEAARSDPTVADYREYLTDLYWLAGFRGFNEDDFFNEEASHRRRTKLHQLAAAMVQDDIIGFRELRGGLDIDLYLRDQFRLIGHTGLHSWGEQTAGVKLIVGGLTIQGDLWSKLTDASGLDSPLYQTYWGTRALMRCDENAVAQRVEQANEELNGSLAASVMFRCWFHRFKDVTLSSETWSPLTKDKWHQLAEALRHGEPPDGRRVSESTMREVQRFVIGPEAPKVDQVVADLKSGEMARQPSHHAVVILHSSFDPPELTTMDHKGQIQAFTERHAILARLLRDLSAMAETASA